MQISHFQILGNYTTKMVNYWSWTQIDKSTASALKQYTVRKSKSKNKSQEITKIVFHDKISALDVLAKYLNLDKYQDRP